MKIISIKQFKAPKGAYIINTSIDAPQHGQLVRDKNTLLQFVVPSDSDNCGKCYFSNVPCDRIACDGGHYAEVNLHTTPFTAPKETNNV